MAVNSINNNPYARTSLARAVAAATETKGSAIDAVYADESEKEVKLDDFLQLMITQLTNQDFMNPTDDTEFLSQMAQFSSMQQMQNLAAYSKSNYMMSLLGKEVTVTKLSIGGKATKITGIVDRIAMDDEEMKICIGGNPYELSQIVSIDDKTASTTK